VRRRTAVLGRSGSTPQMTRSTSAGERVVIS
jgi:hypothetical protein